MGGTNPLKALADPVLRDLRQALRQDAVNLPSPVNTLVGQMAQNVTGGSISTDATQRAREPCIRWRSSASAAREWKDAIRSATAARYSLVDFASVFGPGGLQMTASSRSVSTSWSIPLQRPLDMAS